MTAWYRPEPEMRPQWWILPDKGAVCGPDDYGYGRWRAFLGNEDHGDDGEPFTSLRQAKKFVEGR